jgi:hypothetical protein
LKALVLNALGTDLMSRTWRSPYQEVAKFLSTCKRPAGASRIVVIDLQQRRLDAARRFGATDVIDSTTRKPVEAVRDLCQEALITSLISWD